MKAKLVSVFALSVFVFFSLMSPNVFAEYYVVYSAPTCFNPCCCAKKTVYKPSHKIKKHYKKIYKKRPSPSCSVKPAYSKQSCRVSVTYTQPCAYNCCGQSVCGYKRVTYTTPCGTPVRRYDGCHHNCKSIVDFPEEPYDDFVGPYYDESDESMDRRTADDVYPDMNIDN